MCRPSCVKTQETSIFVPHDECNQIGNACAYIIYMAKLVRSQLVLSLLHVVWKIQLHSWHQRQFERSLPGAEVLQPRVRGYCTGLGYCARIHVEGKDLPSEPATTGRTLMAPQSTEICCCLCALTLKTACTSLTQEHALCASTALDVLGRFRSSALSAGIITRD